MSLIKITPDKERAKSILKMINLIEDRIKLQNKEKMSALIISDYYEIIKELATSVLLIDGYKTLSHKELFDYLVDKYSEFRSYNHFFNDLRVLRNRVSYEGFFIDKDYLDRNEFLMKELINKLKKFVKLKL